MKVEEAKDEGELVKLGPNLITGEHNFTYISGTEVQCTKCPLGYVVGANTEIKDGHIYIENKFLV
jgi:hypothetical protein